jgi:hypothetical protein
MKARLNGHMVRLGIAGALLALAACTGDANPLRDAAVSAGVGAQAKPAPDFVASSRPGELDYIRPGIATRAGKAKSADDVKAFEAQMEKTRAANESRARAARELGAGPAVAPNP